MGPVAVDQDEREAAYAEMRRKVDRGGRASLSSVQRLVLGRANAKCFAILASIVTGGAS